MPFTYDIVLCNARVVDPANDLDGVYSVGIKNGRIAEVSEENIENGARQIFDLEGLLILPGLIDIHTHLTMNFGGSSGGHHMLAKAGVCTALDLAGPAPEFLETMRTCGAGLNAATLESARPGENLSGNNPDRKELDGFIASSLESGSLGVKLLGGHFPMTPDASASFVDAAATQGAYVSWHAGSTETCNTIAALREVLECSDGHHIHVAHINSYCRGMTKDALEEVQDAFSLLARYPKAFSEAYLSENNGTMFVFNDQGKMKSNSTGRILDHFGFGDSPEGLEQAMRSGFARVLKPVGLESVPLYGEEAVKYWNESGRNTAGGFTVNPAMPRIALCLGKYDNGDFRIDAISTDGGAIPRNVLLSHGLSLVALGGLTLAEFVRKTSYTPSRLLNLRDKGHLGKGADADITVVDLKKNEPVMTMVGGKVCMYKGIVTGTGGTVITSARGEKAVRDAGLNALVVDTADGPLPFRKSST